MRLPERKSVSVTAEGEFVKLVVGGKFGAEVLLTRPDARWLRKAILDVLADRVALGASNGE